MTVGQQRMSHREPHDTPRPGRWLGRWLLAGSGVAVVLGTLVPATVIGWVRVQVPLFTRTWDWLNLSLPALNPLHVILYAWMAMLWFLVAPKGKLWRGLLVLVAFSVTIEALQLLVPGRNGRLDDVLNDLLGITLGLALGAAISWMLRSVRRPKPTPGPAQTTAGTTPHEPLP